MNTFPRKINNHKKGIYGFSPGFLHPKDRNDGLCYTTRLIEVSYERDFMIPGCEFEFGFNAGMKYKYVRNMACKDLNFSAHFCYRQGYVPGHNYDLYDISGIEKCSIPGYTVIFYDYRGTKVFVNNDDKPVPFTDNVKNIFSNYFEKVIAYIETFPTKPETEKVFTNSFSLKENELYSFIDYPTTYPFFYC